MAVYGVFRQVLNHVTVTVTVTVIQPHLLPIPNNNRANDYVDSRVGPGESLCCQLPAATAGCRALSVALYECIMTHGFKQLRTRGGEGGGEGGGVKRTKVMQKESLSGVRRGTPQ